MSRLIVPRSSSARLLPPFMATRNIWRTRKPSVQMRGTMRRRETSNERRLLVTFSGIRAIPDTLFFRFSRFDNGGARSLTRSIRSCVLREILFSSPRRGICCRLTGDAGPNAITREEEAQSQAGCFESLSARVAVLIHQWP